MIEVNSRELPLPPHYDSTRAGEIWHPGVAQLAERARAWRRAHRLAPARDDTRRVALLLVDMQNSFCVPGFELFVAGRSGRGAVEDTARLCSFLYRNLGAISRIFVTVDSHLPVQIFHPCFWVDRGGRHPNPFTAIRAHEVEEGAWTVAPDVPAALGLDRLYLEDYARHYTRTLEERGKYALAIWPYHVLLGSVGHALVPLVHEAVFFHAIARASQPSYHPKGNHPLTDHYSVFGPEVERDHLGKTIAPRDEALLDALLASDAVVIAGQAKSHCLAWSIDDLLGEIRLRDARLAEKVYLLEDCTSPVVVPGADHTAAADAAFARFRDAGMHVVRSTDPLADWPGFPG